VAMSWAKSTARPCPRSPTAATAARWRRSPRWTRSYSPPLPSGPTGGPERSSPRRRQAAAFDKLDVYAVKAAVTAIDVLREPAAFVSDDRQHALGNHRRIWSSASAGSGCSMNSTFRSRKARALRRVSSTVQPQLASTRNTASVCWRNWRTISKSWSVPSLILYTGQPGNSCSLATIVSIESMPIV